MRKALLLCAIAGLLLGSSAGAQDDQNLQPPDQGSLDQQPQQQVPETTQPGTGGTGEQQVPQAGAPTPQPTAPAPQPAAPTPQPAAPAPQTPAQQQPGVGGAGGQPTAGCQCPDCPMNKGGMMGPGDMMGPARYGVRLGEISKITVDNTRGGATIHFEANDSKDKEEVQTLSNALATQWQAMGLEAKKLQQQQQPANK